jgi:hypothetical protein
LRVRLKPRIQDHSGFFSKGGEKMAPKKEPKGNIFNFFEDASKNPSLQKKMFAVIKTKGKGMKPEGLLKKFHDLGYYGVSLRDCSRMLIILKSPIPLDQRGEWAY